MHPKLNYPLPENVERHTINVQQTARWFHIGAEPSKAEHVVIVLHGYGQHPAFMLGGLSELKTEGRSVCAPEALSRFYVRGTEGRVGASWMTRDDRLTDIADHLAYLNNWLASLEISPSARLTLVGFSQGVATAGRWLSQGLPANQVIFHSGTIPLEWHDDAAPAFSLHPGIENIIMFRGDTDTIYPEENHLNAATLLRKSGYKVETVSYNGGHKMLAEHLAPYL